MDASMLTSLPAPYQFHINHPDIAMVSVLSPLHGGGICEIAFFDQDNEWILDIQPEFAGYAEPTQSTLVYTQVPKYLVSSFIDHWS